MYLCEWTSPSLSIDAVTNNEEMELEALNVIRTG